MKRQRGGSSKSSDGDRKTKGLQAYFRPATRSGGRQEATISTQKDDIKDLLKGEEAGTIEENILALLDTQGIKETEDIEEDKLSFLEAVHAIFIASSAAKSPSGKIYKAVFSCLQDSDSDQLAFASYKLLLDLDRAWSPLKSNGSFDVQAGSLYGQPVDITYIIPGLSTDLQEHASNANFLVRILTLHFLVQCWKRNFEKCKNVPDESFVHQQLRKLTTKQYENFLKDLIDVSTLPLVTSPELIEVLRINYVVESAQSIITMAIEIERSENVRRDTIGVMLELFYNNDDLQLASFLQTMTNPQQKLDLVTRFLLRMFPKSVKKQLVDDPSAACFKSVLDAFSDAAITKAVRKCMKDATLQLLLAHGFQALMSEESDSAAFCSSFTTAFRGAFSDLRNLRLEQDMVQALLVADALKGSS